MRKILGSSEKGGAERKIPCLGDVKKTTTLFRLRGLHHTTLKLGKGVLDHLENILGVS